MSAPSPEHCRQIIPILRVRDGAATRVGLSNDRALSVFNIAWGDDLGDDFEHITSNISPQIDGVAVDFFFTDEVDDVVDPLSGKSLWKTDGIPNVR